MAKSSEVYINDIIDKILIIGGSRILGKKVIDIFEDVYFPYNNTKISLRNPYKLDFSNSDSLTLLLDKDIPKTVIVATALTDFDECKINPSSAYKINIAPFYVIRTKFCEGITSGSDALYTGLKALNITKVDEVIVPSFTFTPVVGVVVRNVAISVFIDVYEHYNIDSKEISKAITTNTKAVIAVHLFWNLSKIRKIKEITEKNSIVLIEDTAQANGKEIDSENINSLGNISCFSVDPGKNLWTFRDERIICTNDVELDKKIRVIREYGQRKKYYHEFVGLNSRLGPIQAAILNVTLKFMMVNSK